MNDKLGDLNANFSWSGIFNNLTLNDNNWVEFKDYST